VASKEGNEDIVSLLLENGSDRNIINDDGKTPLQIAQENDQQDCAAVILQNQIANLDEQAQAQGIEEAREALEYLPEDMDIDQVNE